MGEESQQENFKIGLNVVQPQPADAFVVMKKEWERIKARINKCGGHNPILQSLGWFLLGIAVSAFFAAIVLPINPSENNTKIICWAIFGTSAISGLAVLICCWLFEKNRSDMKQIVLDDMKAVEERNEPNPDKKRDNRE